MKCNKNKCFRRKYFETSKNRGCGNIFPNSKKNEKQKSKEKERKGKEKLHIYYLHYIKYKMVKDYQYFLKINKQILEIKIIDLFVILKKFKTSFMGCEKDIGSTQKGHF